MARMTEETKEVVYYPMLKDRLPLVGVRKALLDKIPQLVNVIKGDMSLIGPQPLLSEYLPLYNEKEKRRHEVRLGVTG